MPSIIDDDCSTAEILPRFVSEVYEIRTQDPSPRFQKLARLDILLPPWAFSWGDLSMRENQAILHSLDGILVWDYTTHRYAVWSIRDHTSSAEDIVSVQCFDEDTPKLSMIIAILVPGIHLPCQDFHDYGMGDPY